ncbi:60s ribosomal protein l2, mitochondrial [Nicotiana attenuata]|uniref:60s ribosomal protein l2, mitochondrial n=1 Tax=Nicotiana attenuata TaxID=49451 RepID=A0A1J6J9A5_NICAT|nr:60s ribosomal protein l2, mitochondrial [Nicotiana attenuata]
MATYVVVGLPTRMPSWSKSPFFTCKDAGSKKTCAKDVFFSALSSPKAKGETAPLSFGSSFGFPRIAVAGAKPAFFAPRMREKVRGKNTFSLYEIRKWRTNSILWVHRIKRKAALSWQSFRRQETLGLVGASERNESKPKTDQGSLPAKPIGEGLKDGRCKVDPPLYVRGALKCNFDRMRVSNPAAEMSSGFLGLDEWPATFYRGQAVTIERLSLSIPSHTGKELTSKHLIGERGNAHEAPAEREGLPGRMPMGAGFFEKARADSETWDLGLVMNEGKLFELSPPAAYVVVGLIKLAKPRFPLPFTY